MTDTATTRNRLRKQETGTNTNTWGTNLNEVLDAVDQTLDGVETINLTASTDYTLTTTNYTTADQAKQRVLLFTGSLSSAVNVIIPSVEHTYLVYNACGQTLTVKTSAGTGPAIPTGFMSWVYCDGSNVYTRPVFVNGALEVSGVIGGVTDAANDDEATNLGQVSALIAAQLTSGDGSLLVSADDTTRKFLEDALTGGQGISIATQNPGGNETSQISADEFGLTEQADQSGGFTAVAGNIYPCDCSSAGFTVTAPASPSVGDTVGLWKFGSAGILTWGRNSSNVKGVAENGTIPANFEGVVILRYSGATRGWV